MKKERIEKKKVSWAEERLQCTIARIRQMEQYFDEISEATKKDSKTVWQDEDLRKKWQTLLEYYEGDIRGAGESSGAGS